MKWRRHVLSGALVVLASAGVGMLPAAPRAAEARVAVERAAPAAVEAAVPEVAPGTQLVPIRFGSPQSVSDAGIFIARDRGYFREQGFDVQSIVFQSAPNTIAPLASGDLELAGGTFSTGLLNAVDRGIGIKAVADKGTSRPGFEFSQLIMRPDLLSSGAVRTAADLRGKRLGAASTRSGVESLIAQTVERGGLTIADVELVELGYPEMVVALSNGAIDGGNLIEPTLSAAITRGVAASWDDGMSSVAYGGVYQSGTLFASDRFLAQPEQARRWMTAYLRGIRDYNDAFSKNQGRADVVRILTENTSVKDPAAYEHMNMPGLDPDGNVTRSSLQRDLDFFRRMGYYTGSVTSADQVVDTTAAEAAAQQLGPYR
jgi:NitT/TauT family transport system substrate-binding protein